MANKYSSIKERILYLLEIKGIVKDKFFPKIGMTYGNFTGNNKKTPLNSTAIANILSEIPDVNLEWLLTGKGDILKPPAGASHKSTSEYEDRKDCILQLQQEINELQKDKERLILESQEIKKENKDLKATVFAFLKGEIEVIKKEPKKDS